MNSKKNILTYTWVVWLGALVCCALWGGAFPGIKIGYRLYEISPADTGGQILFAGCRFFLAGILAVVIGSVLYHRPLFPKRGMRGKILWLCMLQTVGQYFFFYVGLAHTTGVNASIIQATNVFVSLIVASLIFRMERMTSNKIFGSLLGFSGVVLLNIAGAAASHSSTTGLAGMSLTGEGAIFLSTVMYAFSSVYMKEYAKEELPFTLSGYQFIAGGVILTALGFALKSAGYAHDGLSAGEEVTMTSREIGGVLGNISGVQIAILLMLAGISAIAYSLWGQLLKYNPVSKVTVFGFMTPVFGVIFSAVFLREKQAAGPLAVILALVLVSAGTLIAQRQGEH